MGLSDMNNDPFEDEETWEEFEEDILADYSHETIDDLNDEDNSEDDMMEDYLYA
jgi:hypothetical protein